MPRPDEDEVLVEVKLTVPTGYSLQYWESQINATIRHRIYPMASYAEVVNIELV